MRPHTPGVAELLGDLLTGVLGGLFGDWLTDLRAKRLQRSSRLECALRVLDGARRDWAAGGGTGRPA
jgi:hypothetical protein